MSYNIEGKLANQRPNLVGGFGHKSSCCSKCGKNIKKPEQIFLKMKEKVILLQSYIGTEMYIYETKSGKSVVYCSRFCRNKHNHRFTK